MVYLFKMVIFHGYVSHNQMVVIAAFCHGFDFGMILGVGLLPIMTVLEIVTASGFLNQQKRWNNQRGTPDFDGTMGNPEHDQLQERCMKQSYPHTI